MVDREKRIDEIAYHLWVRDGRPHGQSDRHWHEAVALFEAEVARGSAGHERPAEPSPARSAKLKPGTSPAKSKAEEAPAKKPSSPTKPTAAEKPSEKVPEPPAGKASKRKPAST